MEVQTVGMTTRLITLELPTCHEWRTWLRQQHASSPGVWLLFYKNHTGIKSIPYDDSVREALCFGWVDSLIKNLDDKRYARKFTPRRPASKWSDINRKRWAELKAKGRLAKAGLATAPTDKSYSPLQVVPGLPTYIAKALRSNPKAWSFFQALAPTYRRHFVVWIHSAKRTSTREKRLRESITLLAAGTKLGLK
jgi:uncharacterized protein YdeI (YjbR/CyaY-like superfamily)